MNKKSITILGVILIILIGTAAYFFGVGKKGQPIAPVPEAKSNGGSENSNSQAKPAANITYLVSKENKTRFCNGGIMDSEAYRKTITTEVVSDVPIAGLSEEQLAKETAILATDGMCHDVLKNTGFKVTNGTVEIAPIEGWAGISIAMCACKPQVEVNLLRIPGIKQVVWSSN